MSLAVTATSVRNVLTRTTGYLRNVTSHSLQPYRGCTYGRSLCGVGCYVRHVPWVTAGREWGTFLEVRTNAANAYLRNVDRERAWAARNRSTFSIFLSSATDPFLPQERELGITRSVLDAMRHCPPDELVVQTHSDRVVDHLDLLAELGRCCRLRVQVSIEGDRDRLPGLPAPAASVGRRFEAVRRCREAGLTTVVTVAPLHAIADPRAFFERVAAAADAVVIDHFIGGDGSSDGGRTRRTALPEAMARVEAESVGLAYRDRMVDAARAVMPGRVGVGMDGFAGRYA